MLLWSLLGQLLLLLQMWWFDQSPGELPRHMLLWNNLRQWLLLLWWLLWLLLLWWLMACGASVSNLSISKDRQLPSAA